MKKLLMMIGAAVCLALGAYADTAATYTAGVPSLAGGKITFEYDGSDNITKMRMKPDYGETLTLSGDTLSFADGITFENVRTSSQSAAEERPALAADDVTGIVQTASPSLSMRQQVKGSISFHEPQKTTNEEDTTK